MINLIPKFFRRDKVQKSTRKPLEPKETSKQDLETIESLRLQIMTNLRIISNNLNQRSISVHKEKISQEKIDEIRYCLALISKILRKELKELEDIDNLENFDEKIKNSIEIYNKEDDLIALITTIQELAATLNIIERQ